MKKSTLLLIALMMVSCNSQELIDKVTDITPPKLLKIEAISNNQLVIECNEEAFFDHSRYISKEGFTIKNVTNDGNNLKIEFNEEMDIGAEYTSEFKITDKNNNYVSFIAKYYGFNNKIPKLLINEFICKGTDSNPDKIELYVKENGNIGGVTIYSGVRNNFDSKYIFPPINVNEGDFIVVRSTSKKFLLEYIEVDDLNVEFDKKFVNGVRDIRTSNLKLSSTNGVISIYNNPYGKIMDCVVYTKNNNNPDKRYRNFGLKKIVERVDIVSEEGQWHSEDGIIFPEDCTNIDLSTTTRSVNRREYQDTASNTDWYICKSKSSTFGAPNSIDEY